MGTPKQKEEDPIKEKKQKSNELPECFNIRPKRKNSKNSLNNSDSE